MGRYTVGAVLSIAFDSRLPILEANSQRVLSRLFGRKDDPTRGPARKWLWQAAEALLPRKRVGDFNQALMEVGSQICTPTSPRCTECPLVRRCEAKRLGIQEQIPPRARPAEITEVREVAVVIRNGERVLLVQRPATGRWAGLWEFPHGPICDGETPGVSARRIARELTGVTVTAGEPLETIRHAVTRYRITLLCLEATLRRGTYQSGFYVSGRWLEPGEIHEHPVSAPQRRIAAILSNRSRDGSGS
jgi:A/G-specific adenine glycosylase